LKKWPKLLQMRITFTEMIGKGGETQLAILHQAGELPAYTCRRSCDLPKVDREPATLQTPTAQPAIEKENPMAKAAKAAKANTVTMRHLGISLSELHGLPKKQMAAMLEDMVALITRHLKKGDRIRMAGLGVLQVRKRPARMGRNPATGEQIKIKASKKVAFRASKELKEAV
jgi:DNA-binding protein HU-beta